MVLVFESQHHGDGGEVETRGEQIAVAQSYEVVGAVAAGPAGGPGRLEYAAGFV